MRGGTQAAPATQYCKCGTLGPVRPARLRTGHKSVYCRASRRPAVTAQSLPFAVNDLTLAFHRIQYLGAMAEPEHRYIEHWSVTAGPHDIDGEIGRASCRE